MSLLHRVSSTDSFTLRRSSLNSTASPHSRKLSFSPIDVSLPAKPSAEPVAAYQVSPARRILQVGTAVGYCLLAAGPVFGYAALKPVLIKEGVYAGLCNDAPSEKGGARTCYEQELRYCSFEGSRSPQPTSLTHLPSQTQPHVHNRGRRNKCMRATCRHHS